MPYFSVVIPLFNKEHNIANTLHSVINQSFIDYEIIIINDGSTDNSEHIVSQFTDPRIKYFYQTNQGAAVARNKGINTAQGNYIALLDADDHWFPNHLEEFKKSIDQYPDHFIFCNNYSIKVTSKNNIPTHFSYLPKGNIVIIDNYFKSSLFNSIASSTTICIHNSVFKKGYNFDQQIASGQDTDLWIRLGLEYKFIFNKNVTAIYNRYIDNSLSKTNNSDARRKFTLKFIEAEKKDKHLKKYIDLNRFSIALQYKIDGKTKEYKQLLSELDQNHLNQKQKLLIRSPKFIIVILKKIQELLIYGANIRLTSFK
ncbi:glycosyltransferase [Aquimarina sp. 2201CG5-10]|uniref:glycosyltransferase n=1 Tax=Aquimarina callyspongiae TaxID=3098150 RepID=UPI002AB54554|nr:glycosyltransferase [Aquimarina sp. 2201CG5-10]MDY8138554.1 glycosyltransferase [Aquimarina sp. 2201CG5-10]